MRRLHPAVGSLALLAALAACSRNRDVAPAPVPALNTSGAPAAPASASKGTLAIGEPITQPVVPLAEIAKDPSRFASRVVATTGKVTAVCQEMGCWMELRDESGQAHVRMHGHAFFVPKTASGHVARVQATIVARPGEHDCEEGAKSSPPGKAVAKVELDATGVELD
jgi:hypothetical protein